jgi:hypothetical protein
VTTADGVVIDQGFVPVRKRLTPVTRQPVPRTLVRALLPTTHEPASQDRRDPGYDERAPASQETAAGSSQSVVAVEDDSGRVWDSYRLASSPSRAKFIQGGPAYRDEASGRLRVARPVSLIDTEIKDPFDTEGSESGSLCVSFYSHGHVRGTDTRARRSLPRPNCSSHLQPSCKPCRRKRRTRCWLARMCLRWR